MIAGGNGWLEKRRTYTAFYTETPLRAFTSCQNTFRNGRASLFISACHDSVRMSVNHYAYGN